MQPWVSEAVGAASIVPDCTLVLLSESIKSAYNILERNRFNRILYPIFLPLRILEQERPGGTAHHGLLRFELSNAGAF